jgi:serine/threonine protein kinase
MFLSNDGRLKVLDFGVAKLMRAPGEMGGAAGSKGGIAGTLPYMSPEQIRGADLDGRSDLFSLGVVLYELATGKRPFEGSNPALTADAVLHQVPPAPSSLNPRLSPDIDWMIARLLEKDRERRYQQASEVATDLQRRMANPVRTARHRWIFASAVAAAALACGGGAVLYRSYHAPILTGKDKLVLADFVNTTGDPVFDGTPRQGLAVQLEQSPYLSLISDERIGQTLQLMRRSTEARRVCN